jgi:N-acetylneuraminic acid mutarotase
MPTSRSELAAAALAGRIYVAGGIAQWGTTAAFEAYDPATDRWEELPPLPEAVHHLAAAATDKRVYVTGGYTNLLFSEITKRAWAYDPGARRWTGLRICRGRGQRTAWRQSRAGSTWSAA